jgi:hypothetical protein
MPLLFPGTCLDGLEVEERREETRLAAARDVAVERQRTLEGRPEDPPPSRGGAGAVRLRLRLRRRRLRLRRRRRLRLRLRRC